MKMRKFLFGVGVTALSLSGAAPAAIVDDVVVGSSSLGRIWRLDGDTLGQLATDAGFGDIRDISVQPDDSVLVSNPTTVYRRDGLTLDQHPVVPNVADFSGGNSPSLHGLAVRTDGSFLIGDSGYLTNPARVGVIRARSADTNNSLANSPDDGYGQIVDVGAQSNGNMVVLTKANGGAIYVRDGNNITAGVSSDSGFGDVTALTITHDDYVLAGTSSGDLWQRFDNVSLGIAHETGLGNISALATLHQSDGAGNFVAVGNTAGFVFVRMGNVTQGLASGNFGSAITAMTVQSDDDIVIGTADGLLRILRINGSSLDTLVTSDNGGNTFGTIADLGVQQFVPEPAALSLLGLAGITFIRRRQ